ncbi:ankyrin repeat-containing domain protein [Hyaloscypha sp. PMI_1271]|nr:ankyrin repeat-containing domain protein [Hyaloscypha sp. PMI_1271]
MAEIVGVVASGISIVQVAGQLLGCIEKLRALHRSMRDVPEDLQSTLKDIETIEQVFSQVQAFDESCFSDQALSFLRDSLENCQAAASALENLITGAILPLKTQSKLRTKHLLQAVFKKEDMKELKLSILEQINTRLSSFPATASIDEPEFTLPKSKNRNSALVLLNAKNASLWVSLTQVGVPLAVRVSLDFVLSSQQSHITPSLGFQRVVRRTSPGFKLLWELEGGHRNDWGRARQDLLELFESGEASPRDVDPDGNTWLEKVLSGPWWVSRRDIQFSLFYMLVELGTQINTQRLLYQSIKWIGEGPHMILLESLIQSGFDVSEIEAPSFALWPQPCSPNWIALDITPDPFFVDWISMNLKICPGFAGMNPLLEAILIESSDEVKRLITKIPINDQDNLLGQSALHLAVFRPQHLEILLDAGADANARDRHGITPLMYAAAMGNSPVAIRLLCSGADPSLEDDLLKGNFLVYARERSQWTTIVDVLGQLHDTPGVSEGVGRSWLTLGAMLWVSDRHNWTKDLKHFFALLERGADANVVYQSGDSDFRTLAHDISDEAGLKALISHGFTKFNHLDGEGAHAILSLSGQDHIPDPGIMELLLNGGSLVNHQNQDGHTTLHAVTRHLRGYFCVSKSCSSDKEWHCNRRTQVLDCIRILLDRKADPFLGDKCCCACSRSGCTPVHLMLQVTCWELFHRRANIWVLEFFAIMKEVKGLEAAKQCLLDLLRLVKFHELELTHTCCPATDILAGRRVMEDGEVEEIMDEEREIVEALEQEMQEIEKTLATDLDQALLTAIFQLSLKLKMLSQGNRTSFGFSTRDFYKIDYWRDQFVWQTVNYASETKETDTVEVIEYSTWVEHEHSKHQRQNRPDTKWYEKRIEWIATIQNMNKRIRTASREANLVEVL